MTKYERNLQYNVVEVMDMLPIIWQKEKKQFRNLKPSQIVPNPNQPRIVFETSQISALAESICEYGIINPLTVRETAQGFELIAGERRLRAAIMAEIETVPCYIMEAEETTSSVIALVENLQRQQLDFFEEAQAISNLQHKFAMTQQQIADKIGKTQSAVANKLRILKLPTEAIYILRDNALTERHARALLKLGTNDEQAAVAAVIAKMRFSVAETEKYIERIMARKEAPQKPRKKLLGDVRFFINTLDRAVRTMKLAGVGANLRREYDGADMVVTIRIPSGKQPELSDFS